MLEISKTGSLPLTQEKPPNTATVCSSPYLVPFIVKRLARLAPRLMGEPENARIARGEHYRNCNMRAWP